MTSNTKPGKTLGLFLIIIYFFSGFAALVYQVVWQRWLVFFTGISSVNISLIVSAFMAGLGLGYLVGGYLADKLKAGQHAKAFLIAEIGIGLFAVFSKTIFYDWLYMQNQAASLPLFATYLLLFVLLLIPTFLMGVSLPLLSKSFNSIGNQGNFISLLYFTNTLGSAIGTFCTAFYLIPNLGFEKAVYIAAALNFFCGISVFVIFRILKQETSSVNTTAVSEEIIEDYVPFKYWMMQYFISGFAAIALEIVWFRMIDVMMKSYAVTFSLILTIYLGSMAVGSLVGVYFNSYFKGPKLKIFLITQYILYLYVAVSIALLHFAVTDLSFLEPLRAFFEGYDVIPSFKIKLITMVLIPVFLMSLPTFIMGFSFSVSQNIIQRDFSIVGRKVGGLQFINIVGSTLGAWFATLVGFEVLGSGLTIKLMVLIGLIYVLLLVLKKSIKPFQAGIYAIVLIGFVILVPGKRDFWKNLSGVKEHDHFVFGEDKTALSSIKIGDEISNVFINGLGQSLFPMKDDYFHIMLGAIPAFVHPNPKEIGIIGLGSSATLYGASGRESTSNMDCWEVIKSQPGVLMNFVERTGDSSAYHILNDKRLNLILDDGRKSIQTNKKKYDILEADGLRPRSSYSGNLYSVEYFRLLQSKLKPGGMAVTWAPTQRIKNGFKTVFPYVYEIQDGLYLGSDNPVAFDINTILSRLDEPFSQDFYQRANIDIKNIMINFLRTLKTVQSGKVSEITQEVNTDMWPKDEYERN
jgi:spermidine synthase